MINNRKEILNKHKTEYINMLTMYFLPFWMDKTDKNNGGFFTCYNIYGDQLISKDKYVWSQGRCVWIYAKLAEDTAIPMDETMRNKCRNLAIEGGLFLEKYCFLNDGQIAFVLDENNKPKKPIYSDSYAASSFADCFVAMGLSAVGVLQQDQKKVRKASQLLFHVAQMAEDGTFQTAPDIAPDGWRGQAPYMILINTAYEIGKAVEKFEMTETLKQVKNICTWAINTEMKYFVNGNVLLECLDSNYHLLKSSYGRHINPGHTLECMWFILEAAQWLGMRHVQYEAIDVMKYISDIAWDKKYGGIYYYLDRDGGAPQDESPIETASMKEKVLTSAMLRDWSNKMWWPHLEAMYANLIAALCYEDEKCWIQYLKYREYTLKTFPNENPNIGEWIQIRDRKGAPLCQPVGGRLPVKDPYHLLRAMMLFIDRIAQYTE